MDFRIKKKKLSHDWLKFAICHSTEWTDQVTGNLENPEYSRLSHTNKQKKTVTNERINSRACSNGKLISSGCSALAEKRA